MCAGKVFIDEQQSTITDLKATVAQQQKQNRSVDGNRAKGERPAGPEQTRAASRG